MVISFSFVLSLLCLVFFCFLSSSEAQEGWHQALQQHQYSCYSIALFIVFLKFHKKLGYKFQKVMMYLKLDYGLPQRIVLMKKIKKETKCPVTWMQQVIRSSRELFLLALGHIPQSNRLYALEIALNVRRHALQKHKTVLCYLLIIQKALITLFKEKKKKKGKQGWLSRLSRLFQWELPKMCRPCFQHHGPVRQGQMYMPSSTFLTK